MFMHAVIAMSSPDARYQHTIVAGRAMIYRIRCVKFRSKNRFPRNPLISDTTLSQ
jgi:hypothetical protein